MEQLKPTIEVEKLTLADWLSLAQAIGNEPLWGFFRWLELTPSEVLESLSRKQVKEIAERLDYSIGWIESRITEYS
ncbi:MAG: hypothetical protein F6K47_26660 [Symploca sp. SIO2E6]|nr:hypothetical protein [Symploca sp. SIO2E6]